MTTTNFLTDLGSIMQLWLLISAAGSAVGILGVIAVFILWRSPTLSLMATAVPNSVIG